MLATAPLDLCSLGMVLTGSASEFQFLHFTQNSWLTELHVYILALSMLKLDAIKYSLTTVIPFSGLK